MGADQQKKVERDFKCHFYFAPGFYNFNCQNIDCFLYFLYFLFGFFIFFGSACVEKVWVGEEQEKKVVLVQIGGKITRYYSSRCLLYKSHYSSQ